MRFFALAVAAAAALVASVSSASAAQIPLKVSGTTGSYHNGTAPMIDGVVPHEGSPWNHGTTYWSGRDTSFTYDMGGVFKVEDLQLSVDNNDGYIISTSLDGVHFSTLIIIQAAHGEIWAGMDTFSTVAGNPEYVSAIDFLSVNARYLRIQALNGDNYYSIGEFQAFGEKLAPVDVPEPATLALLGSSIFGMGLLRRRSRA